MRDRFSQDRIDKGSVPIPTLSHVRWWFVPGLMEDLNPGKDERHGSTEEVPRWPMPPHPEPSRARCG